MVAPTPPKPQTRPTNNTPKLGGKIKAPKPQQVAPPGAPPPLQIKGKMIAPKPIKSKGKIATPQPPKKKGEMPAVKPPQKKEKNGNLLIISGGIMAPAQPPKKKK